MPAWRRAHATSASFYPRIIRADHLLSATVRTHPITASHGAPPRRALQGIVALVSMAAVAVSTSPCGAGHQGLKPRRSHQAHDSLSCSFLGRPPSSRRSRKQTVLAAAGKKPGEAEEKVPAWARPGSDEPPPWAREGGGGSAQDPGAGQVPFYAYLLASAITAIAAIGSIFEYTNQRPVFGIINPDSALYAPLLGFFVFTGIPTSGFLWFKAVQTANKEAEEQDRRDGFLD